MKPSVLGEQIRESVFQLGDDNSIGNEADPAFCPVSCSHPDCRLARGLLAAMEKGRERIATWRVHKNDSADLPADLWAEVEQAIAAAMGL